MIAIAEITLVENSTAGNPPRVFSNQRVEIRHEKDTYTKGADGSMSIAQHPSTIKWFGGVARDMKDITDVKIRDDKGLILIAGELNRHHGNPRPIEDGVEFYVMRAM